MSVKPSEELGSEGRWFGDDFEKIERIGSNVDRFDVTENALQHERSEEETRTDQRQFVHQAESNKQWAPVAMETTSTANLDYPNQLKKSPGDDLYTSLLSGQPEVPYVSGDLKQTSFQDRIPSMESHGMFSSDSGIEMTPGESIDVAKNLLESEKMEAYNYMDISHGEQELQRPLEGWGESTMGCYLEKGPSAAVETLGPALDTDSFPYVEDLSDEEQSDYQSSRTLGTPRTASPIKITLTETPAELDHQCPPQISVSERESILSLGLEGVPTVTLSEPEDDSPGSCTPPFTEEEYPSDPLFQASGVRQLSSVQDRSVVCGRPLASGPSESSLPAGKGDKAGAAGSPASTLPATQDQEDGSAESGDSEIEVVPDEPQACQHPPSGGYMSFIQPGGPVPTAALSTPLTPPAKYSILREEREAELDSELILESCDASSASEESPKREQDSPVPPPPPTPSEKPAGNDKAKIAINEEHRVSDKPLPISVMTPTPPKVEQPILEEKGAREVPPSEGGQDSMEQTSAPVFFTGFNRQKAVDLLYWRDLKQTGLLFGGVLLLLFSLTQFSVVSVIAYLALAALSATISFRIYKSVLQAVQKTDEGHPFKSYLDVEISLSQEQIQKYADSVQLYFNSSLKELRRLFLVQDLVDSLKFAVLMWLLTYVGALFNGLTLLILAVVSMFTVPVVYEKHQAQIDQYLGLVKTHVNSVVGKIQEKIPGAKRKAE